MALNQKNKHLCEVFLEEKNITREVNEHRDDFIWEVALCNSLEGTSRGWFFHRVGLEQNVVLAAYVFWGVGPKPWGNGKDLHSFLLHLFSPVSNVVSGLVTPKMICDLSKSQDVWQ